MRSPPGWYAVPVGRDWLGVVRVRLEVLDFSGPTSWRWRLTDPNGGFLADHAVELDAKAWEFEAFTDLHQYLRWNAAPDRRLEHEAELVAQMGDWITRQALGPAVAEKLARARGAVRLEVPAAAAVLGYRPWELARHNGRTLVGHRVSFVVDQQPHHELPKQPVGERLRMLAVFSLPDGAGALNLRRERHALTRLVQEIAKVNNKAIDLRVLQYGATRQRLEQALLEQPGWDVIHLSGHGLAGGLVLETDTGAHDLITSDQLVDLLDYSCDQIKLVTLSACESAAVTAKEHLQQLGLADLKPAVRDGSVKGEVLPAVAAALVERLDCAVLAMRYPVVDDFAITLASGFYDLLLGKDQPVTRALSLTLPRVTAGVDAGTPALSAGTPVLFGARATTLSLAPPPGTGQLIDTGTEKLARFPPPPERFVGRVGPLTRASTALAPGSSRTAVVFHGMAGGGKTACAVELAHNHATSFPFMAFYKAPDEDQDITTSLTDFTLALERQIPGLTLAHLTASTDALRATLPTVSAVLADNRVLIVLDNVESLLTPQGNWRDERWELLIGALAGHPGLSRLVMTSRTRPTELPDGVVVEAVHALSLRESVLLAREWPHLKSLIDATPPAGLTEAQARELGARTLSVVQGHPKLLELADGLASHPDRLAQRLAEADQAWLASGTRLDTFLSDGESAASDQEFLGVLRGWTRTAATTLPASSRLLFELVCGLEEPDRDAAVMKIVWPLLWQHLYGHTDTEIAGSETATVEVPDWKEALAPLVNQALVAADLDPDGQVERVRIHPGIADTTRTTTAPQTAAAIDNLTGNVWIATLRDAQAREYTDQAGALVVRAARSAGPYLLRRNRWKELAYTAEQLLYRDGSTAAAAAAAPLLAAAVEATRDTPTELSVGCINVRALGRLDPTAGETQLRRLLRLAFDGDQPDAAAALTSDLINLCVQTGRLDEALTLADTLPDLSRRAGSGPWTQLIHQGQRLRILRRQGRSWEVLNAVEAMRERWVGLPDPADPNDEAATPFSVREATLALGCHAARELGLWEQALELNAVALDSKRGRGASVSELAFAAFNDYGPLIELGRLDEARALLIWCREVDEANNNIPSLAKTLGALADVEEKLGHRDRAISLSADTLRYAYLAGDPGAVALSHHKLADYLRRAQQDPTLVWAHRLAAALISYQTGDGQLPFTLRAIARPLDTDPDARPDTVEQVITTVERIDGVRLAALLERLPRQRASDNATALNHILTLAADTRTEMAALVAGWDPILAALHTARRHPDPDTRAAAAVALEQVLTARAQEPDWASLAVALRRLLAGDHDPVVSDPTALTTGLDDIDTTIIERALDLVTGRDSHGINPDTWTTLTTDNPEEGQDEDGGQGLAAFVAAAVAAADGDTTARTAVGPVLEEMAAAPDWATFAATLQHLIDHPTTAGAATGDSDTGGAGQDPDAELSDEQAALLDTIRTAMREARGGRPDPTEQS